MKKFISVCVVILIGLIILFFIPKFSQEKYKTLADPNLYTNQLEQKDYQYINIYLDSNTNLDAETNEKILMLLNNAKIPVYLVNALPTSEAQNNIGLPIGDINISYQPTMVSVLNGVVIYQADNQNMHEFDKFIAQYTNN